MIVIKITETEITIDGHAGYGPYGQDIICAAVSMLAQSFIYSVEALTEDKIAYEIEPGHMNIKNEDLSESGKLLKRSFCIAVEKIQTEYGDSYIQVYGADGR